MSSQSSPTADTFNSPLQLPTPKLDSILSRYIASGRPPQKTPLPLLLHVDFTAALIYLSQCCVETCSAQIAENTALLLLRVRFRGNMFTEPLPSNELFRLSGVMSQYKALSL
jgi:hypothetical protein